MSDSTISLGITGPVKADTPVSPIPLTVLVQASASIYHHGQLVPASSSSVPSSATVPTARYIPQIPKAVPIPW